jgi:DNA-binding MarR family transcriptional regulator
MHDVDLDGLVEDGLCVSRALVEASIRSIASVTPRITLLQYRTLVVLASCGPQRLSALRTDLGTQAPAVTRLCNRLAERGLAERRPVGEGTREVEVSITPAGAVLLRDVTEAQRRTLARIAAAIPPESRQLARQGILLLGQATGEPCHLPRASGLVP